MPGKITAIIFDLDNTLLDFMKMKKASIRAAIEALLEAGLIIDRQQAEEDILAIYREHGFEYQEVLDVYIEQVTGELNYRYLAAAIVAYRRAKEASLMMYPRANATLLMLAKMGLKLGVVSDAPSREAWLRICYLNLHHIFDAVVTFDDTGKHKPAREPFEKICNLLEIEPEDAIMVGDWPERDMVGAKQMGMRTAFAKYGDLAGVVESGADYVLEDIYQLVEIVERNNNI